MYKIKCDWYVNLHKSNATYNLQEKDIWLMVLDGKLDDNVYLPPEKREKLNVFAEKLWFEIDQRVKELNERVEQAKKKRTY